MDVCLLDQAGATLLHRHRTATPEALRKAIAPYRAQIVVAAECMVPWYWLAALCADHGIPGVLGPALSMKAIHGGQANNDTIDAQTIVVLLRGGMLPQASGSPAERRATRALRRRRMPLARTRGELLVHVHHTHSPSPLPAIDTQSASKTNRDGVAERCAAPAVHKSIAVDLALLTSDDALRRDVARTIVHTAKHHDAHTLSLRQTVPGIGTILRRVRLDDLHQIARCPRVQDCASECRVVTCAKASAGQRSGTAGTTIGHAPRTWACAAAAVFCLRDKTAGQTCLARWEKKHRQGKALTIVAHTLARAVYCMLQNQLACDMDTFLRSSGRGVGELAASLDNAGMTLTIYALLCPHTCVAERR